MDTATKAGLFVFGVCVVILVATYLYSKIMNNRPLDPADLEVPDSIAQAGKRMGAVAKQAQIFAEVAMLLVNKATLQKDVPRIGACLFIAGAIDCLSQKAKLNDVEYLSITSAVLETAGLVTSGEAYTFASDLPEMSKTAFGRSAMSQGGETVQSWLSGKNEMAPAKLSQLVDEWADTPIGSI